MTIRDRIDWSSRYELMGGGMELEARDMPEIEFVASSEVKMSIKGTFIVPDDADLLTTRLCPYITINGIEYPCGRYIITSADRTSRQGEEETELTGYSVLYLAKRTTVEDRLHFAAGAGYLATVRTLLIASGITAIITDDETDAVLQTAREDWDPGTSYLEIINQLLGECGYADAWPDMQGAVHLSRPASGSAAEVTHKYAEGQYSIIADSYKRSDDRYGKYNVIRVVCANPDLSAPMVATAELTDPAVPYSIPNIGRVAHVESVDNIASQTELQRMADELMMRQRQLTQTCEFYTACDPTHACRDVTALSRGEITGIWRETGWRLPLSGAYNMTHTGERVIYA